MVQNAKSTIIFLACIVLVLVLVLAAGFFVWLRLQGQVNFVIKGVPPVTIFNHVGDNSYVVVDTAAALISILKYYGEDLSVRDIQAINGKFFDNNSPAELGHMEDVKAVAEELGYSATIEVPRSIEDFKRYFEPGKEMPVLFSHFIDVDQDKSVPFKPIGVLIGMLDAEQSVVVHDYYYGYNKKLSYDEFKRLGAFPARVLVIRPKDGHPARAPAAPYKERTAAMDKAESIINIITIARAAQGQKLYDVASAYFRSALSHPDFESVVPPYYKVVALSGVANSYIRLEEDYGEAEKYAVRAQELNHNLDKPFGDFWPGFVDGTNTIHDEFAGIHYWLGRIYEHSKEYQKAIAEYERALAVYPYGPSKAALEKLLRKNR